jgi:hypothetical protein
MASIEPFSGPRPAWVSVGPVADEATSDESPTQEGDTGFEAVHAVDEPVASAGDPAFAAPVRPSRFLGDLMRAMLATAEEAKTASVEQSRADAKGAVEAIHGRSADEASGLRRDADDDIAGIREWSKSEMARIREETERRIAGRKEELASELEAHAARIEREIDVVQRRVAAFETNLQAFFGTLVEATDPTMLARIAERMPEPPRFDSPIDAEAELAAAEASAQREAAEASAAAEEATSAVAVMEPPAEAAAEAVAAEAVAAEAVAEPLVEPGEVDAVAMITEPADVEALAPALETVEAGEAVESESAAVEPAEAEASAEAEAVADAELVAPESEPQAEVPAGEPEGIESARSAGDGMDAEAALEARLAGLAAVPASERTPSIAATTATRVSVTGFVSVAGIASFKRHLSRLPGVLSVGVSSSPDGEFVFNVSHEPSLQLREILPTLPGFAVRVLKTESGALSISAHDPSADA